MTIDTKRLETDAAYWLECGAPEDATHYEPGEQDPECWAKIVGDRIMHWSPVEEWHVWNPKGMGGKFIPRPTTPAAPEWDGESMISVGEWAEGLLEVADGCREWQRCRCIGFLNGMVVVCSEDETMVDLLNHTRGDVRPLRTKEQRQRDELRRDLMRTIDQSPLDMNGYGSMVSVENAADAILSRYNLEPKP